MQTDIEYVQTDIDAMKTWQRSIVVRTSGRGSYDITSEVTDAVRQAGVKAGLCHLFVRHTSASLMLCENADPDVRRDLETFMGDLVPDGDPRFVHTAEGPDDMAAHVRTVLTHSHLSVPLVGGRPGLGTWQGIYLWEHRTSPHSREVVITVQGNG